MNSGTLILFSIFSLPSRLCRILTLALTKGLTDKFYVTGDSSHIFFFAPRIICDDLISFWDESIKYKIAAANISKKKLTPPQDEIRFLGHFFLGLGELKNC